MHARTLSHTESIFASADLGPIVVASEYTGDVDVKRLQTAVNVVVRERPLLGARIIWENNEQYLVSSSGVYPEIEFLEYNKQSIQLIGNESLDRHERMARIALLLGDEVNQLVVAVDHCVIDGRAAVDVLKAIWSNYGSATKLNDGNFEQTCGLPASVDSRISGKYSSQQIAEFEDEIRSFYDSMDIATLPRKEDDNGGANGKLNCSTVVNRFGTVESLALVNAAKNLGTSLNGLISGIVVLALRRSIFPPEGCASVSVWTPVDLRDTLSPKVPLSAMTNCVGNVGIGKAVPVESTDDPVAIGRHMEDEIGESIQQGLHEKMVPIIETVNEYAAGSLTAILSNVGRFDIPDPNGFVEIKNVDVYLANRNSEPLIVFFTCNGRFSIQIMFDRDLFSSSQIHYLNTSIRTSIDAVLN